MKEHFYVVDGFPPAPERFPRVIEGRAEALKYATRDLLLCEREKRKARAFLEGVDFFTGTRWSERDSDGARVGYSVIVQKVVIG